jgi:tRNA dimethylallyltransferase
MNPNAHTLQWLAIAGPTASGKTALALAIAERWPVEIISVDSALVYRGMDIGSAKPSPAERARVPHHLIDIRDPSAAYSAAEFVRDATVRLHAIRQRGRLPVLVGGTMLYFKALFEGLDDLPPAQPALRARIEQQAREQGWPALHGQLASIDPVTAARLSLNDTQRIGRALEVFEATGQPLSLLHTRPEGRRSEPGAPLLIDGLPGALWSLEPTDRGWLHQRIAERFTAMLAQGLVQEVERLRARGDLHPELPAMRCVGYRQTWEQLDLAAQAGLTELQASHLQTLYDTGVAATRQLAKRQLTWLRSMPLRRVWPCEQPDVIDSALQALAEALTLTSSSPVPRA